MKNSRTRFPALWLVAMLLMVAGPMFAEEAEAPYDEFPDALGGYLGFISGIGLHYHKWMGPNGFQVTGGLIYNLELSYSLGGEYQRKVYGDVFTDWLAASLYLFAGGSVRGVLPGAITGGGGVGVELILFRHVSVPVSFGYAATWDYTADTPAQQFSVGPAGQVGLRYRY